MTEFDWVFRELFDEDDFQSCNLSNCFSYLVFLSFFISIFYTLIILFIQLFSSFIYYLFLRLV